MLQRIRDSLQTQRWLAYTILGILAVVFAAWGAYGVADFTFGGGFAAKVDGETIPLEDTREAWMRQQAEWEQRLDQELPPEQKQLLQDQVLEAFVRARLLDQRTRELGYRVSNEQLAEAVRSEPAFQIEGQYRPEVAKAVLAQAGISATAFEQDLRRDLQRAQVQNAIRLSNFLTPRELERIRALENEEREVRYALLPVERFAAGQSVADADVQAYYERNRAQFTTPESVHLQYAELRLEQVNPQVALAESDLRAEYERNRDRYVQPEKRRARHILIEAPGEKEDPAALERAQRVLAEAQSGADFAALARKHSQDPGSAAQGGDLGWAERNYFVAPFAEALFSMAPGEIRGPVRTEFGYHIIRLEEVQPGGVQTFEQARPELEAQLRRDRAHDRFGDIFEQLEMKIERGENVDFAALAGEFGMQVGEVPQFTRGEGGAPFAGVPEAQNVVFSNAVLNERRIGGPVALGEDRMAIFRVLAHRPAAARPLAEVRDQIVAALRTERAAEAALKAAEDARQRLEAGASLEQVAKDLGVPVEPARFVGRNDPSVPASVREAAFGSPRPAEGQAVYRTAQLAEGGAAVVALTDVRTGSGGEDDAQLRAMRARQAAAMQGASDAAAYVEELRRTARVQKNPRAFE